MIRAVMRSAMRSVSLNVGEADFADGKLADRVLQRLDELALPHSCLTIEVTESVFLGDEASSMAASADHERSNWTERLLYIGP